MSVARPLPYDPPEMAYNFLGSYDLCADFTVSLPDGRSWTVRKGYRTDLATSPRIFWWIIPPTGAYEIAAVLHDWMCTDGIRLGLVTSREADEVFRELMRLAGVGLATRWLMWAAVRCAAPFSPDRRPSGFLRDLPAVVGILVPALLAVGAVVWALDWLAHFLLTSTHLGAAMPTDTVTQG